MTEQDIDRIENAINHIKCAADPWAVQIAVEAMRKQIPKELIADGDGYADWVMVYDSFYCSSCDYHMEDYEVKNYCPNCGQTIDWEEK